MKIYCSVTLFGVRGVERTLNRKYTASCVHVHTDTNVFLKMRTDPVLIHMFVHTHVAWSATASLASKYRLKPAAGH